MLEPAETRSPGLSGALHEVSNALTVVSGWIEVALRSPLSPSVQQALVTALTHARLGHQVARRAIGAEVEPERELGTIGDVVTVAVRAVHPMAESRAVTVRVVGEPEAVCNGVHVLAPDTGLQVLVNLLLNALAFSPRDSVVVVRLRIDPDRVVLEVADEGPGIAAVRAESLLEAPESTRPGGAGIGLVHCSNLARQKGGQLRLKQGAPGAVFELEWPRRNGEQSPSGSSPGPVGASRVGSEAPNLDGLSVLLLEDDDAICGLLELAFGARGATVSIASSLDAAIVLSRQHGFDVVLVDLSPIADRLTEAIATLGQAGERPLVLITGSACPLAEDEERAFSAWVRKPFETAELIGAVARVAGRD